MGERADKFRLVTVTVEFEDGSWEIRHRQHPDDVKDWVRRLADGLNGITSVRAGPYPGPRSALGDVSDAP